MPFNMALRITDCSESHRLDNRMSLPLPRIRTSKAHSHCGCVPMWYSGRGNRATGWQACGTGSLSLSLSSGQNYCRSWLIATDIPHWKRHAGPRFQGMKEVERRPGNRHRTVRRTVPTICAPSWVPRLAGRRRAREMRYWATSR
jgi:hypothetical protein